MNNASSENQTIVDDLTTKQGQVRRLEGAALFPSASNLDKKTAQVDDFTAEVDKLHSALVSYQTPLKDIAAINSKPPRNWEEGETTTVLKFL